jgi:hypothetical protein
MLATAGECLCFMEDLTPDHLRCSFGGCPGVYRLNDGDLLIIGKVLPPELMSEMEGRVGPDEFAVKISPDYFGSLLE